MAELVERCARLPLALRIAAEAIGARAGLRIADVVAELDLDALDATGDSTTDIRAVFSWSYRHLDDDAARLFRLMGRHPWEAQPAALAALAGLDRATTGRALAVAGAGTPRRGGRGAAGIGMHDLLRAYAAELPEPDTGAVRRLFAWYVRAAAAARQALIPQSPPLPMTGVEPFEVTFADGAAALAWFEAERPVLVALVTAAAEDDLAWRLAGALLDVLQHREALGRLARVPTAPRSSVRGGRATVRARRPCSTDSASPTTTSATTTARSGAHRGRRRCSRAVGGDAPRRVEPQQPRCRVRQAGPVRRGGRPRTAWRSSCSARSATGAASATA